MLSHPGAQLLIRLPVAISSDCPSQPHLVYLSHVVASPGHGAAPPGHTVAPPGHTMASPGHSMAPPSHITASSNHIAAPPGLLVSLWHLLATPWHLLAIPQHLMAISWHLLVTLWNVLAMPWHFLTTSHHLLTTASPGHIMASSGHSMASPDSDGSFPCLEALQAGPPSPVSCRGHHGGHQQQGHACPTSHGGTWTTQYWQRWQSRWIILATETSQGLETTTLCLGHKKLGPACPSQGSPIPISTPQELSGWEGVEITPGTVGVMAGPAHLSSEHPPRTLPAFPPTWAENTPPRTACEESYFRVALFFFSPL